MPQQKNSEVARLMAQIEAEHEAAQQGLQGVADGTAKHRFIMAHMGRMWSLKAELSREVGEKEALTMICCIVLEEKQGKTKDGGSADSAKSRHGLF
jgi:hypothetical protein